MARLLFNKTPPLEGRQFPQPLAEDFPREFWKNGDHDRVLKGTTDYIRNIVSAVELVGNHSRVLIDIKVQDLKPGMPTCIPGWHCDSVVDVNHPSRPEVHHLFVTGFDALTQFIDEPIELNYPKDAPLSHLQEQIKAINPKSRTLQSATWTTYGRTDFHRGAITRKAHRRLLVRVTETDLILPSMKPRKITPLERKFGHVPQ